MLNSPFSISPDPLTLYLTVPVRAALQRVRLTIDEKQGLAAILGDIGLGKSTILRYLFAHYDAQEDVTARLIPTPQFSSRYALMKSICQEYGIVQPRRSLVLQQESFMEFLGKQHAAGRTTILFLDEAQVIPNDQLEQIRVLLNYETNRVKLVQIVLAGQLDLRDRLQTPKNKPILSRIVAPTLLNPLTYEDMVGILRNRCSMAEIPFPFTEAALKTLHKRSAGIPRTVLSHCLVAYRLACELERPAIDADLIEAVANESELRPDEQPVPQFTR